MGAFDDLIPGAKPDAGGGFDDLIPAKPKPASVGDVLKEVGASAVESVGSIAQAGGELVASGVNAITGSPTLRAENPLSVASEAIRNTMTAGGKAARQDTFKGDVFDPSTWEGPKTGSGLAMGIAQGAGSLVATLGPLGAAKIAGAGAKAMTAVGALAGGAMTGGAAAEQTRKSVRETFAKLPEIQLMKDVPAYREAREAGMDDVTAKAHVEGRAALYSNLISGAAGAVSGAINAKLLDDIIAKKGISLLLGKVSQKAAVRTGVGAGVGAVGEGAQEVTEQVGQNVGENLGLGLPAGQNATRDTFGAAVLGAAIGGPVGGVGGAVSTHQFPPGAAPPPGTGEPPPETNLTHGSGAVPGETIDTETGEIIQTKPGLTPEQEDIQLRIMERQALQDQGVLRGQQATPDELAALAEVRGELNAARADLGLPPVTMQEWQPIVMSAAAMSRIAPPEAQSNAQERPLFPWITEKAAQRHADQLTRKMGEPYVVVPHPTVEGRFASIPANQPLEIASQEQRDQAPDPGAPPEAPPPPGGIERRTDTAKRKLTSEMTDAEKNSALLTHPVSGLPNKRAWEEAEAQGKLYPFKASIDLDDFKNINDIFGHATGDEVLAKAGKDLQKSLGPDVFHFAGDEFGAQGEDEAGLRLALDTVKDRLSRAVVTVVTPDGRTLTQTGIGFSYGTGPDLKTADFNLQADKAERKKQGLRVGERKDNGGVPQEPAAGDEAGKPGDPGGVKGETAPGEKSPSGEPQKGDTTDLDALFDQAAAEVKGEKNDFEKHLDAAAAAQPDAKGRKPSKDGIYEPTETLTMDDPRAGHTGAGVRLKLVELADGTWKYGLDVNFANGGSSDQLSFKRDTHPSRAAAISDAMAKVRLAAERALGKGGQDAKIGKAMQRWSDGLWKSATDHAEDQARADAADAYEKYAGKKVKFTERIEGGKKAKYTIPGPKAMRDIDARIVKLRELRACLA